MVTRPDPGSKGEDGGSRPEGEAAEPLIIERVYSAAELREIDRLARDEFHMPTLLLMEHAARAVAETVVQMMEVTGIGPVLVVCGAGQNAGDGLAAARLLDDLGLKAMVALVEDESRLSADATANLRMARARGVPVESVGPDRPLHQLIEWVDPVVLVDAMFGTGLSRPVEGATHRAVDVLNHSDIPVLSVDVPSGLHPDTGEAMGDAVIADVTISFTGHKVGFESLTAQRHLGELIIDPIGLPRSLLERFGEPAPHPAAVTWRDEPHPDEDPGEPIGGPWRER